VGALEAPVGADVLGVDEGAGLASEGAALGEADEGAELGEADEGAPDGRRDAARACGEGAWPVDTEGLATRRGAGAGRLARKTTATTARAMTATTARMSSPYLPGPLDGGGLPAPGSERYS
jgi:hypothetical protein